MRLKPHLTSFWEFSRICGFREQLYNNNKHRFRPFSATSNDSIFFKSPKTSFLGHFGPKTSFNLILGFFSKNRAPSLFFPYGPLTSCKKSEKAYEPMSLTFVTDRRQKEKMFSFNVWFDSDNEQYDDKMIYDIKMKTKYDIKPWQWWQWRWCGTTDIRWSWWSLKMDEGMGIIALMREICDIERKGVLKRKCMKGRE